MINLLHGDCLEVMRGLPDNSVDSVVTDPPYGLSFMGKKWDIDVPATEVWAEAMRVLKPGGHLISFGGTRTYHRMAVAIEDAGFEIRDMVSWIYGSGFPKSLNIGKAVDKLQGNERELIGINEQEIKASKREKYEAGKNKNWNLPTGTRNVYDREKTAEITKGNSPHEGWGTALKPAQEPCVLARKPLSEKTVAANVLRWGTGGLNIDDSRVHAVDVATERTRHGGGIVGNGTSYEMPDSKNSIPPGRFPANIIHDGSDEVLEVFPDVKSGASGKGCSTKVGGMFGSGNEVTSQFMPASSGSAARFFYCAKTSKKERNMGFNTTVSVMVEYTVWNDKKEINEVKRVPLLVVMDKSAQKVTGVSGAENKNATEWNTVLFGSCTMEKYQKAFKSTTEMKTNSITPSTILNWLTHLLTNDYTVVVNSEKESGGSHVVNAENSSTLETTMNESLASALGVKGVVSGTPLKISVKEGSNTHSTVKPIALMEYMVKLITPPGGTVLDPYMGSGSTGIAAKSLGHNFIGIELDEEYMEIAKARMNG